MDMMRIELEHPLLKSIAGQIHQICLDHFLVCPGFTGMKGELEICSFQRQYRRKFAEG
jgi:hypothetical protein